MLFRAIASFNLHIYEDSRYYAAIMKRNNIFSITIVPNPLNKDVTATQIDNHLFHHSFHNKQKAAKQYSLLSIHSFCINISFVYLKPVKELVQLKSKSILLRRLNFFNEMFNLVALKISASNRNETDIYGIGNSNLELVGK